MLSGIFGRVVGWKIWGIVGAVFAALAYGLKLRGDHYERKADNAEAQIQANDAVAEVKQFEAINLEKAKQAQKDTHEEDSHSDDDSYHISV